MRISTAEARRRGYDPAEIARIELAEEGQREADELILLIERVFTTIPKPQTTLSVARALDDEWIISEERAAELAKQDPETDWREVPEEKTRACQEYFTFADPPGWRFYLPAFMTHYLREFPGYGYDAVFYACVQRTYIDDLTAEELSIVEKFAVLCHKYEGT